MLFFFMLVLFAWPLMAAGMRRRHVAVIPPVLNAVGHPNCEIPKPEKFVYRPAPPASHRTAPTLSRRRLFEHDDASEESKSTVSRGKSSTPCLSVLSGYTMPTETDIEQDFALSYVTDRPQHVEGDGPTAAGPSSAPTAAAPEDSAGSDSAAQEDCAGSDSAASPSELEKAFPLPKAGPRKGSTSGRRKRKAAVLTDCSELAALEEEQTATATRKAARRSTRED